MNRIRIALALSVVWLSGCALQQDVVTLDKRTLQMERQVNAIDDRLSKLDSGFENRSRTEESLRSQSAEVRAAVGRMTEQTQQLRGRVETAEYQFQQELAAVSDTLALLDARVKAIEDKLGIRTSPRKPLAAAPPPEPAPEPARPASDEEKAYNEGIRLFDEGKLPAARERFEAFLKRYPDSTQADNAQFWIAETYYREQWLEKAILEYQKVIENYPKGNKVPGALLKQALAFAEMGDKENAKLILEELVGKFPQSSEAAIAQEKIKQL